MQCRRQCGGCLLGAHGSSACEEIEANLSHLVNKLESTHSYLQHVGALCLNEMSRGKDQSGTRDTKKTCARLGQIKR